MKKIFKNLSFLVTAFVMVAMASCSNDAFDEVQPENAGMPGTRASSQVTINNSGSQGVLVLQEGNMTSENGFINFIKGGENQEYKTMVSGKRIANVTQDLAIFNDKIYVIAQNSRSGSAGGGVLTILNATDFSVLGDKIVTEIQSLNNPTHIAVFNENTAYLRASGENYDGTGTGNGIYKFNLGTKLYTRLADGGKAAAATPMTIAGGYLYVCYNDGVRVYNATTGSLEGKATNITSAQAILKSTDGTKVYAYSSKNIYEIVPGSSALGATLIGQISKTISTFSNGAQITYYNNSLYYSSGTKIYKFSIATGVDTGSDVGDIFDGQNKTLVGTMRYNGIAIDPGTGYLYVATTVYGVTYSDVNMLHVMKQDDTGNYVDYKAFIGDERFTAGIFFPANFNTTVTVGGGDFATKTPEKYDPNQFYE